MSGERQILTQQVNHLWPSAVRKSVSGHAEPRRQCSGLSHESGPSTAESVARPVCGDVKNIIRITGRPGLAGICK